MIKEKESTEQKLNTELDKKLILFNDDINTFEHVIDCLVSICDHTEIQAEQCALITHYTGKCEIKKGSYKSLKPYFNDLRTQGLFVVIQ